MIWKTKRTRGTRTSAATKNRRPTVVEQLEVRRLLAADPIHVGVVYIETDYLESDQDVGSDSRGDRFILTFSGGAPDTELKELRIRTDKDDDGISVGDPIYDTQPGGRGKRGAHDFQVVRTQAEDGREIDVIAEVEDGGQELVLRLSNFRAGDRLEFTIDVDEVLRNASDLAVFNDRLDVITSGQEFQDSILSATFQAPHFEQATADAVFLNDYGDPATSRGLDLPPDEGAADSRPNRSAAAVASTAQTPKPIEIGGRVWIDNDLDAEFEPGEGGLGNVEIALWTFDSVRNQYVDSGHRATTDDGGRYLFPKSLGILPGRFRVTESQPAGYFSVAAVSGTVEGAPSGTSESLDALADIDVPLGDSSASDYDFAEAEPSSLSGFVYQDSDNDGIRDPSEVGVPNVQVQLVPINTLAPQAELRVTTGADGSYEFAGLAPGEYEVVEVTQPPDLDDGLDAAGTIDGIVNGVAGNDRIREVTLRGDDHGVEYNFGELAFAELTGFVFLVAPGEDCDGPHDAPGNVPLSGIELELQNAAGGTVARTTTDGNGQYRFDRLSVGTYRIVQFNRGDLIEGMSHPGSIAGITVGRDAGPSTIDAIVLSPGDWGVAYNFCETAPASISGHVYRDDSNDGQRDPGETGLPDVQISLVDPVGNVVATKQTDSAGRYEFTGLLPGEYRLIEQQPAGFLDGLDAVGTVRATPRGRLGADGDSFVNIELRQGDVGIDYNFGELLPASLSGQVHADLDDDCVLDPGEQLLAGVVIRLLDESGTEVTRTTTDAEGRYSFSDLLPGNYSVIQEQPTGFFEGGATPGDAGGATDGPNRILNVTLTAGQDAVDYNFCDRPPAELAGFVFADSDGNCLFDSTEIGIEGVRIELYDRDGALVGTTFTDAAGRYRFANLAAGEYTLREEQPAGWIQGSQGGPRGDASSPDAISGFGLGWGESLTDFNFCELEPAAIVGQVFVDGNGDCLRADDEPPLEGVTIELRDAAGSRVAETTTDANGAYRFEGLTPGYYEIVEHQPAGYLDGGETGGQRGDVLGNDRLGVELMAGETLVGFDFCELLPAAIIGQVYVDGNGDCVRQDDEPPLAGVTIELRDASGNRIAETTTDANGEYRFENLMPGDYQVFEQQPGGYLDGGEIAGDRGRVLGNDLVGVQLMHGETVVGIDFCEFEPAAIVGQVFVDGNGDCLRDDSEPPLSGVTIELRDAAGRRIAETTTDTTGEYRFEGLVPGDYQIFEHQPLDYFDGGEVAGTRGEVLGNDLLGVTLLSGETLAGYDFCELAGSSIRGRVWQEQQPNQQFDEGDSPLADVVIELTDDSGALVGTTTTDASGNYRFESLPPGIYSIRELQPTGFFHGGQLIGNAGGRLIADDFVGGISLTGGTAAQGYDFPEVPPATISGFVFQDGDALILDGEPDPRELRAYRDGRLTEDDALLGGVTVELRNVLGQPFDSSRALAGTYPPGPIRAVTDAAGFYEFRGLRPGTYHIYQLQPEAYVDGLDTPGSSGGLAVNPADEIDDADRIVIQTLALNEETDPRNDAILNIGLIGGQVSENNNFSELVIVEPPPPVVPPPPPPIVLPPPERITPEPPTIVSAPADDVGLTQLVSYLAPQPPLRLPSVAAPLAARDEWNVTWHLSVINGGYPRGESADAITYREVSFQQRDADWNAEDYRIGRWTVANRQGELLDLASQITLGHKRGSALAGDFDGDGVDEVAIYVEGEWFVDLNGNGSWDEGDLWIRLGTLLDRPVVGDWDGDGKDDVGIFGRQWQQDPRRIRRDPGLPDPANRRRRLVDTQAKEVERTVNNRPERLLRRGRDGALRADIVDHVFKYGEQVDQPVSGDWNGDGIDQIAIFRGGQWLLDSDGDGRWTPDDELVDSFGRPGDQAVVGDFNGDQIDEIGVVRGDLWIIDTDGDRRITGNDLHIQVPRRDSSSQPVVGDFDGDGKDEPGYYDDAA